MNIDGQVAVVTGGASGLGEACVTFLRKRGARVMVWDRLSVSGDTSALTCDVRVEEDVAGVLNETIKRLGVPRICVHCAGIAPAERLIPKEGVLPLSIFKEVMDINVLGTFHVMRRVANAMSQLPCLENSDERGVIINTASIAAYEGQIGQVAYSASKGGVVAMTLPAARELAQYGIRVNAIAPGVMATPMLLKMPQAVQERLSAAVPFPKRLGLPEEFAALAMHMIENSLLNGEVVRLDGALRMSPR